MTPMQQRMLSAETRIGTLEAQIISLQKSRLGDINDEPASVKHAFALREIVRLAELVASRTPQDQDCAELLSWVQAIK